MGASCSGGASCTAAAVSCTDANCIDPEASGGGCAGCQCCGAVINNAFEEKKGRRNSGVLLIEERPTDGDAEEEKKKKKKRKKKKKDEEEKEEETKGDPKFKSEDVKLFIRKCLTRSGVFQDEVNLRQLTEEDIDKIVDAFEMKTFEDGQYLFHKGDYPCDTLYIAKRGTFRGLYGKVVKAIMKEGDVMGEIGFFHESPRALAIVADNKGGCATYALSKYDFKMIAEKGRNIMNTKIFRSLTENQKYAIKDYVKNGGFEALKNYRNGDIIFKRGEELGSFYLLLSGIVRATDATAEELLNVDSLGDDEEKAVDEMTSPAATVDDADPMGISVSRSDTNKSILGISLSGKAKTEGSKVGSVVGFAKTASVVGPSTAPKTLSILGSNKDPKTATIAGSVKDQKAASVAGASSKMAKTIRSVQEPVVRDFLKGDFALLPGGYVGADALLLGKTVCQKTYLAIRESTFLEIKKDFFESDLFVNVRKDLEVDLAIQEKAEDTKSMLRKLSFKSLPVAREFDELGDEEDDIPDPTDTNSSSGGYDCYVM